MCDVWTMGEILVEIMRPKVGMSLNEVGDFLGPYPSGAPAIFIDTVARLGHSAGIIGGVGVDDFGKCILDRLEKDKVDCKYIISVAGESTAVAFVTYFEDGSRKFIYHIGNTPAAQAKCPTMDNINEPKFFHLMGCSLMTDESFYKEIIKAVAGFIEKGAKISFDPNIRPELLGDRDIQDIIKPIMNNCSVLLPGVDELLMIAGEDTIDTAVEKLFKNPMLEVIALKKGSKGCTVYTRTEKFSMGVFDVEVIDPTGAGDSFDAGFISGLIENKTLVECAKMATASGALNTASFGPMEGVINLENIRNLIQYNSISNSLS